MTKTEIYNHLRKIDKRRNIIVILMLLVFLIILSAICIGIFSWQLQAMDGNYLEAIMNAALYSATAVAIGNAFLASGLDRLVRCYLLPPYFIEVRSDVIKVHGPVRMMDWDFVSFRLLKLRPGYRIVADADADFGCTMAAVPASAEYLRARRRVQAMGLSV